MNHDQSASYRRRATAGLTAAVVVLAILVAFPGSLSSRSSRQAGFVRDHRADATTYTLVAFAGDIADGSPGTAAYANASATAARVQAINPQFVLTGGDNAYPRGSETDFRTKYEPTWGAFKEKTYPSPGNHEYLTPGATGYFGYFFGGQVTGRRYYAVALGAGWRGYSLNCEISCGSTSAQYAWLQQDLAANPGQHYLVYLHRPRFTSGPHAPYTGLSAIWSLVQRAGGDLVLGGHNHQYERFAKLNASGQPSASGMVQMVAGAGGAEIYGFPRTAAHSLVRNNRDFGVLRLTLRPDSYSWRYVASGRCWTPAAGPYSCPTRDGLVLDSGKRVTNTP